MLFASTTSRRATGFTLSEVLIALGVLAVGSVAVASLFPAALLLQKETVDEAIRQGHTRSMDAILLGNGLDNDTLLNFTEMVDRNTSTAEAPARRTRALLSGIDDPGFDVFALAEVDERLLNTTVDPPRNNAIATSMAGTNYGGGSGTADEAYESVESHLARFPLSVRCLPTITPPAGTLASGDPDYSNREVYWVPLIRRGLEASEIFGDWAVYVFVLQPETELRTDDGTGSPAYVRAKYNLPGANFITPNVICANPFDPDYFPKVFRIPVTWNSNDPNFARANGFNLFGLVKPGDMVLGDNGKIYKVALVSAEANSLLTLNPQTVYEPLNERDLTAIWVAPATNADQDSPLAEIRLMSNAVVRVRGPQ